jgi:hypothetical protein
MCTQVDNDNKMLYKETVENQKRLMAETSKNRLKDIGEDEGRGGLSNTTATNSSNIIQSPNNETDTGFWKGFVNSLTMIFFVEFGDRVSIYVRFIDVYDHCTVYNET